MSLIRKFWARANSSNAGATAILYHTTKSETKPRGGLFGLVGMTREVKTHEVHTLSWRQASIGIALFMAFLRKKGIAKGDRVAILGWNSAEWIWADYAIKSYGAVTVPLYPNASAEQAGYILKDAGAKLAFAADAAQAAKVTGCEAASFDDALKSLEDVVSLGKTVFDAVVANAEIIARYPAVDAELVRMRARRAPGKDFADLGDEDLVTLMYTSGSSGAPKGCMISHGNLTHKMASMEQVGLGMSAEKDLVLSYLPLSHILENVDGMGMCVWNGVPVALSSIDDMRANLRVYHPTILVGVPAVWEKIYNGVLNPHEGIGWVLDKLFVWKPIFKAAMASTAGTRSGDFFDKLVFNKVRAALGGKLRLTVSGGAPIAAHVLAFFNRLGIEIIEGYGATETLGGIVTNRPSWAPGNGPKNKVGSVGYAVPGCEFKIVNDPNEDEPGTGEIHLFGGQVIGGYWNLPEATASAFVGGWYKTGDLGRMDEDGFLYILGRKDGMYKTSGGKYVSREKLEASLKPHPIVHYSVPVAHGKKYPIALIFVNHDEAAKLIGAKAPAGVDAGKFYAEHEAVKKAVAEAIAEGNKGLEHHEQIKRHLVMPLAATIDNGIITETLKIRSKVLIKRFAAEIDGVYAEK